MAIVPSAFPKVSHHGGGPGAGIYLVGTFLALAVCATAALQRQVIN